MRFWIFYRKGAIQIINVIVIVIGFPFPFCPLVTPQVVFWCSPNWATQALISDSFCKLTWWSPEERMCGERLEMSYVVAVIWWKKFSDNLFISFSLFILLMKVITCIPILTLHVTGCKISLFGRLIAGLLFFFVITHACNICIFSSTEGWYHRFIHEYDIKFITIFRCGVQFRSLWWMDIWIGWY